MIVAKAIESLNRSRCVLLVVEVHIGEALAQSSVLILCQIHFRFLAEFVRQILQISFRCRLGQIGDSNGCRIVAALARILLHVLDEGWNVLAGLR